MKGARRLPATQHDYSSGKSGIESGRQRQARPDHQRETERRSPSDMRFAAPRYTSELRLHPAACGEDTSNHLPECTPCPIGRRRDQVLPEVPGQQTRKFRRPEPVNTSNPRRLKVQIPAPAILVGHHVAVASRDRIPRRGDRQREQRMSDHIAHLTPIEPRVRDHDLTAADEQAQRKRRR